MRVVDPFRVDDSIMQPNGCMSSLIFSLPKMEPAGEMGMFRFPISRSRRWIA
jgi:hypothetical protein